jgi:hypothetical protein
MKIVNIIAKDKEPPRNYETDNFKDETGNGSEEHLPSD